MRQCDKCDNLSVIRKNPKVSWLKSVALTLRQECDRARILREQWLRKVGVINAPRGLFRRAFILFN